MLPVAISSLLFNDYPVALTNALAPVPLTFNYKTLGYAVFPALKRTYMAAPSTKAKPEIVTILTGSLAAVLQTP